MITQEKIDKQYLPISIWRPLLILSIVGAWTIPFALIIIAVLGSIAVIEAFKKVL